MAKDPEFVFKYLKEVESLAKEVLSDKRNLLEANKKRDKSREASRALRQSSLSKNGETWVCSGNLFMSFTKSQASAMLEKGAYFMIWRQNSPNSCLPDFELI